MANELRYRQNNLGGTLSQALNAGGTIINSENLAAMGIIGATNQAAITLYNSSTGEFEIIRILEHAVNATTAKIATTSESGARPASGWPTGSTWRHGPTVDDWNHAQHVATDPNRPALLLRGATNTNNTLAEFYRSDGNLVGFIRAYEGFVWRTVTNAFGRDPYTNRVTLALGNADDPDVTPLAIRPVSSAQNADLIKVERSDGSPLVTIDRNGVYRGDNGWSTTDPAQIPEIAAGSGSYVSVKPRSGSFMRTSTVNGIFSLSMRIITANGSGDPAVAAQRVFLGNTINMRKPNPVFQQNTGSTFGFVCGSVTVLGSNDYRVVFTENLFFIADTLGRVISRNILVNEIWDFNLQYAI